MAMRNKKRSGIECHAHVAHDGFLRERAHDDGACEVVRRPGFASLIRQQHVSPRPALKTHEWALPACRQLNPLLWDNPAQAVPAQFICVNHNHSITYAASGPNIHNTAGPPSAHEIVSSMHERSGCTRRHPEMNGDRTKGVSWPCRTRGAWE